MSEIREFRAHKNLIRLVVERQAGTVAKSILEGVMNSIDAGATRVDVEITGAMITIKDNGKGFNTEKEITDWFEEFGNPHELDESGYTTDAKFGTFRSGRGQLFAFGVNVWVTNNFEMKVDIRKDGLGYTLDKAVKPHKGCAIHIGLYEHLTPAAIQHTVTEISKFCKYCAVDVYVNGDKINTDPASVKWEKEDDFCYLRTHETNVKGIAVYQQGVYVETIPSYVYGISGVVVTKGQLKLNFARNQVIRSCPKWKKVTEMLGVVSKTKLSKKQIYDDAESTSIVNRMLAGEKKLGACRIFKDTSGNKWSLDDFSKIVDGSSITGWRKLKTSIKPNHRGLAVVSLDTTSSARADKVMQSGLAVVLDRQYMYDLLQCSNDPKVIDTLTSLIETRWINGKIQSPICYETIESLTGSMSTAHKIIPENDYTPTEIMLLSVLNSFQYRIPRPGVDRIYSARNIRKISLGDSEVYNGWTDGFSYIAISRQFLKECDLDTPAGWYKILLLLIHELCHDSASDSNSHIHSAEFYRNYHDCTMAINSHAFEMFNSYLSRRKSEGKRNTKKQEGYLLKIKELEHEIKENEKSLVKLEETENKLREVTAQSSVLKGKLKKAKPKKAIKK